VLADGKTISLTVTFGFNEAGEVREVFCADFKAGSDMHAAVTDACILMSRLLQHGDAPEELAKTLCEPPSLIGCIARAASLFQLDLVATSGDNVNGEIYP
jgi:hypothetical protein